MKISKANDLVKSVPIATLSVPSAVTSACLNENCANAPSLQLILITRPLFLQTLQTSGYLDWKKDQGISTGVFTVEWITEHFDGSDIAGRIKNFIQDIHQTKESRFAILIGDAELPMMAPQETTPSFPPPPSGPGGSDPPPNPNTSTEARGNVQFNETIGVQFWIEPVPGAKIMDLSGGPIFLPFMQLQTFVLSKDWEVPTYYFPRHGIAQLGSDYLPDDLPYSSPLNFLAGEQSLGHPQQAKNPFQEAQDPLVKGDCFGMPITVFVARMPVRTTEDLGNILHKTMVVQKLQELSIFDGDDSDGKKTYEDTKSTVCGQFLTTPYGSPKPDSLQKRLCSWGAAGYFLYDHPFLKTESYRSMNPQEAQEQKAVLLNTSPTGMVDVSYHGDYQNIYWSKWKPEMPDPKQLGVEETKNFASIFPLYVSNSCMVAAFYHNFYEPTFLEALMRSPTGPAVVSEPLNPYFFYEALSKGKTIGEANYAGADFYVYGPNPHKLFGDPTLTLYQPSTIPLPRILPTLFERWFSPVQLYPNFF